MNTSGQKAKNQRKADKQRTKDIMAEAERKRKQDKKKVDDAYKKANKGKGVWGTIVDWIG